MEPLIFVKLEHFKAFNYHVVIFSILSQDHKYFDYLFRDKALMH